MAGHLTKRKKAGKVRWRARYPDPSYGGKKEIERVFATRREAERWLREQQVAVQRGTHIDPARAELRFQDVADAWRGTWLELKPKTKANYDNILRNHVLPRWGNARIGAVQADAIQTWINDLAANRSPKTVRNVYAVLRSVMVVAVERHYITVNPCDAVRLPKRNGRQRRQLILTAAEVETLAEAIEPRWRVLVYTAAYTGLRAGELGALRRRDVDLLHGTLHVHGALQEINTTSESIAPEDKGLIFGTTKTGGTRVVGLPRFLVAMLTEHLDSRPPDPDALVFTSARGGPVRHNNFRRRHFQPAVKAALPAEKHGLRFHDLRHTCASLLIAGGAPALAIQEHLGHSDITTTMNVYGHLYPSTQAAMASTLDSAYAATGESSSVRRLREANA